MATIKSIPTLYRGVFTWVDPVVSFGTGYALIFHRDAILAHLSPLFSPRVEAYDPWLWQVAGGYFVISVMQGGLLRYTQDLNIWKICQGAVCIMDIVILCSMWEMRNPPHNWFTPAMSQKDWGQVYGTAAFALIRIFFILEVGFTKRPGKKTHSS
ncbi:putative beta-mannosidase mnda [Fusarium austroafricanum]|uniref:Putative beta-mannosidase mnda n=1 Tax=Fusarium austroafricanum TaxID=2364996 RepID=A0A8H4NIL1_9HYPO|nr:putative beta-mannosidase mnda [Fusarium austroafricanum]